MQKKSFRFDKKVCVGNNLNLGICSKLGGILREFWEILGKYRILDGRPLGSIGLWTLKINIRVGGPAF